jgi:hypothetical protein
VKVRVLLSLSFDRVYILHKINLPHFLVVAETALRSKLAPALALEELTRATDDGAEERALRVKVKLTLQPYGLHLAPEVAL